MVTLPKVIYKFSMIPVRIPVGFFAEIYNLILKCTRNGKGPQLAKDLEKAESAGLRVAVLYDMVATYCCLSSFHSGTSRGQYVDF